MSGDISHLVLLLRRDSLRHKRLLNWLIILCLNLLFGVVILDLRRLVIGGMGRVLNFIDHILRDNFLAILQVNLGLVLFVRGRRDLERGVDMLLIGVNWLAFYFKEIHIGGEGRVLEEVVFVLFFLAIVLKGILEFVIHILEIVIGVIEQ